MTHPFDDPNDLAYRAPLDRSLPFPPEGAVDHAHLKELLYANLEETALVVDVGCGPGPFEYEHFRARFLAFDMFEPVTVEGLKPEVDEFVLGKLDAIPVEDGTCDAVVMGFILEHVTDPVAFVKEADRVLRPGGWCYIAIPNHRSIEDKLFRMATSAFGSKRGPHIQRFTFDNFNELVHGNSALRIQAWHFLPASFLFLYPKKTRWARKPLMSLLKLGRVFGGDPFREGNYQLLYRKAES